MIAAAYRIDLYLPGRSSLKEKRQVLRSLRARLPDQYGAAFAEVADQDVHQRAVLGLALVSESHRELRERENAMLNFLRQQHEFEVLDVRRAEVNPETEGSHG